MMMNYSVRLKDKMNLLFAVISLSLGSTELYAQDSNLSQTSALAISLEELNWGQAGGGNGFPVGVRTARQGTDPITGGVTYYAMFPSGSHFDLHWHTHDEYVVVVQGTVTIQLGTETHSLSIGSYIIIPGKLNHSWDIPTDEDAIILVRRAGPADFHFAEE